MKQDPDTITDSVDGDEYRNMTVFPLTEDGGVHLWVENEDGDGSIELTRVEALRLVAVLNERLGTAS